MFDILDHEGPFLRQVTPKGPGNSMRDRLYFFENRLFIVVGDSEDEEEQDLTPNTILCCQISALAPAEEQLGKVDQ